YPAFSPAPRSHLTLHSFPTRRSSDLQLSAMQVFRPRVAVILRGAPPIAVRLVRHQTGRDCLVVTDDPALRALAGVSRARVVWLSPEHALDHGVYVAFSRIAARLNGRVEEICPVDGIPATE